MSQVQAVNFPNVGAALAFTQAQLGGPCVETTSHVTPSVSAVQLVNFVGDRVALIIANIAGDDAYVAPSYFNVASQLGIRLSANGGTMALNVRDDFTLPAQAWFGAALTSVTNLYIIEYTRFALNK